jgi:hypothetical protein
MKKFFTLVAAALFSSGAFAQGEWQDLVVNGNMEGAADPSWSSFWCHDWRQGVEFDPETGQEYADPSENATVDNPPCMFMGFAEIVEDPVEAGNHCARVVIRSKEEAHETGTYTFDTANNKPEWCEWDSQFFVYANETMPEGMEVRLTMRVRGEKAGNLQTQAHYTPGDYNHYQLFGDINYTTEWQRVQVSAKITSNHTQEANGKFFQAVAFNLSTMEDGNTVYFDDIKLEIREPKGPTEFEGWLNFLRKGTLTSDQIGNYTTFTGRNGIDNTDRPAEVVDDPVDGQPALTVKSIGWNTTVEQKTEVKDEDGNTVLDDDGNPTYEYETVDAWVNEETKDTLTSIDAWRTQFFVTIPHKFAEGEKLQLKMWARAEKPTHLSTQAHAMPGSYIFYQMLGDIELTDEWQEFDFEDLEVTSDQSGSGSFQTIAFNCNEDKEENTFYFRFDEFSANSADVTAEERVVGSETISLPIPEPDKADGMVASVDFTKLMNSLYATDLGNMLDDPHMLVLKDTKDEDVYSAAQSATSGFFLNEQGLFDENGKIIVEVSDKSTIDNVQFVITNEGDSFAGKTANTSFKFQYDGWFYKFNVSLVSEDVYNGIAEVMANKTNGMIYDLSGRQVKTVKKGLYILDGKKFLVK